MNASVRLLIFEFAYYLFQVLMGDLKPAIETHEMLYEVAKRHKFIPEVIYDFKLLFYTTKNDRKIRHANEFLWYPVLPARI